MEGADLGWWGVLIAVIGGAIRISTPYLFVSLGETLTQRSGRLNLGLEGTLVTGAMTAFAISYHTGSPWLGVFAVGVAGTALGALHTLICKLPRVNDIAVGIALFVVAMTHLLPRHSLYPATRAHAAFHIDGWVV